MNVKELLLKTADEIDERGWYNGGWYVDQEGKCVCALGAIKLANGGVIEPYDYDSIHVYFVQASYSEFDVEWAAEQAVERYLHSIGALPFKDESGIFRQSLPAWNDKKAKSGAEVASLFRTVAGLC